MDFFFGKNICPLQYSIKIEMLYTFYRLLNSIEKYFLFSSKISIWYDCDLGLVYCIWAGRQGHLK